MTRAVAIILCMLAWHVVPALCVLGVVAHPCDDGETTRCDTDCDCGPGDTCGHDSDCADDPCSTVVTRPERKENDPTAWAPAPAAVADLSSDGLECPTPAYPDNSAATPFPRKIPYPPSDLPLLI